MNISLQLLKIQTLRLCFEMNQTFYAVARGKNVGIYKTWAECKAQTDGYSFPKFRKFTTESEAQAFIDEHRLEISPSPVKPLNQKAVTFPDQSRFILASVQRSPKSSNVIKRNMSEGAQRSPKSKSSVKQELQSLKHDSSVLKERLKIFMQEQEVLINNIDQKIDALELRREGNCSKAEQ